MSWIGSSGEPGASTSPPRGDAHRPVGEPVGRVFGPDDQARPHHGDLSGHRRLGRLLRQGLQGAVGPAVDLLGRRVVDRGHRGRLIGPGLAQVGIDGDRRDVDVVPDVRAQHGRRLLHPARDVGRGVDDRVPLAALEGLQVVLVAVAVELLQVGEQARPGLAAIEQRDLVPPPDRRLDGLRPEETRCRPASGSSSADSSDWCRLARSRRPRARRRRTSPGIRGGSSSSSPRALVAPSPSPAGRCVESDLQLS